MARLARVVVPGVPHHVTQRGNRRQETFFHEEDYAAYLALLGDWCDRCGVEVWLAFRGHHTNFGNVVDVVRAGG